MLKRNRLLIKPYGEMGCGAAKIRQNSIFRLRNLLSIQFIGLISVAVVVMGFWFPQAIAQTNTTTGFFQGRGIAQGAAFSRGRNANLTLTLDGENFGLEMTEPQRSNPLNRPLVRVQYRGVVVRREQDSSNPNGFNLRTRVRSFDSSENLRVITNTTGTCRIEVFDARVVYSNCTTAASSSSIRFMGLEQF